MHVIAFTTQFSHTIVKKEGELKSSQGYEMGRHFRFENKDVGAAIVTGAILPDSQPLRRGSEQLS